VSVETEPIFTYQTPKLQFKRSPVLTGIFGVTEISWDIHPDDKRFLMIKPPASPDDESAASDPHKINIVLNWFEELKDRVPVE